MPPVGVADVGAEGCDFDGWNCFSRADCRCAVFILGERNQHNSKLDSHGECLGKDFHHLPRSGAGGDIIIGGLASQHLVAHASASEVGLVCALAERADDIGGVLFGRKHSAVSAQKAVQAIDRLN